MDEKNKELHDEAEKDKSKKKRPRVRHHYTEVLLACGVIFVLAYTIANITSISSFIGGITSVLTPIILGFAIAYILNPVRNLLDKSIYKRVRRKALKAALSITTTYIFAIIFSVAVLFLILPELVSNLSLFVTKFDAYIDTTINLINSSVGDYFGSHDVPEIVKKEDLLSAISSLITESGDLFEAIGSYVIEYGKGIVIGVKNVVLAIFISIYMLISRDSLKAQANKLCTAFFKEKTKKHIYKYARICDKTFGGFLVGKIIDSFIIGVITLITLMIFKMPYYVLVSAIVCITNIIPVFGPFIGAIPSFFIIFIVDPTKAFIFLVLIIIIQQIDGNIIGPKILGGSTGMSSLGVIISIIVMGEWFGIVGMIVGVPIFAVTLTIINELAENRLRRKNLPVNSAEYYADGTSLIADARHRTVSQVIFSAAGRLFGKIMKVVFKKKKSVEKEEENTQSEEKENE